MGRENHTLYAQETTMSPPNVEIAQVINKSPDQKCSSLIIKNPEEVSGSRSFHVSPRKKEKIG